MYRYTPPKSNIWGHSLRNMEPDRQRSLFQQFLKIAVADYQFKNGSLTIFAGSPPPFLQGQEPWGHAKESDVQAFEALLGASSRTGVFDALEPGQCDLALEEIISNPVVRPGVLLSQVVEVRAWLIDGRRSATESLISLYYGMKPCLSTFLQFGTMEEFQFVKKVFSDLQFCTLNEKRLKPLKGVKTAR